MSKSTDVLFLGGIFNDLKIPEHALYAVLVEQVECCPNGTRLILVRGNAPQTERLYRVKGNIAEHVTREVVEFDLSMWQKPSTTPPPDYHAEASIAAGERLQGDVGRVLDSLAAPGGDRPAQGKSSEASQEVDIFLAMAFRGKDPRSK